MTILRKKRNIVQTTTALTLVLFIASCGKETAPDPARSQNKLVFELFETLKTKNHKATLKKIERLRIINTDSIFLANLENTEFVNQLITDINVKLNNRNIKEALDLANKALSMHPGIIRLESIKKDLEQAQRIEILIAKVSQSSEASQLRKSLIDLQNECESLKDNKIFKAFVESKKELAGKMTIVESKRLSLFDLLLDIDYGYNLSDDDCWNDLAQLAIEEPNSPAVKHYMKVINETTEPMPFLLPKPNKLNQGTR